jgi:leader peptidase (prepilin peptidase)/N-methyltransferase
MTAETLYFFLLGWVFVFGVIIGSFLNVVIYRYNTGAGLGGRSRCFTCGKTLKWYELIPVASYVIQGGKCRVCSSKISLQYPIVELTTGLLFAGAFLVSNGYLSLAYLCVQMAILMVIAVYDLRHKIIPDLFSYGFAALAFIYMLYELYLMGWQWDMIWPNLLAGPLYFMPFAALWLFSRGRWMGLGDAKLALGIGWFLGLSEAYISMLLAFWIGSIFGIVLVVKDMVKGRAQGMQKITMKSEIPFGPFLVLGLIIMLFFGDVLKEFFYNSFYIL